MPLSQYPTPQLEIDPTPTSISSGLGVRFPQACFWSQSIVSIMPIVPTYLLCRSSSNINRHLLTLVGGCKDCESAVNLALDLSENTSHYYWVYENCKLIGKFFRGKRVRLFYRQDVKVRGVANGM